MKITIEYNGQLRHLAQRESDVLDIAEGTSIPEAVAQAATSYDESFQVILFDSQGELLPSALVLMHDEPVNREQWPTLTDGDVLTLLPPIAGG